MNSQQGKQLKAIQWFEKKILSKELTGITEYTIKRLFLGDSNNGLLKLIREASSYIAAG